MMEEMRPSYGHPLPIPFEDSASYRWLQKTVHHSRMLSDMESLDCWSHEGPGGITLSQQRALPGAQTLRLTSPTNVPKPGGNDGRPFARSIAHFDAEGDDWREYNRISFWVYPDLPGFRIVSLQLVFHNDGAVKLPDSYGKVGRHHVVLRPDEWNHVVWEIADLERDHVTGIDLVYVLQGHEPGAADSVCFDFYRLELEQVDADHYEGWNVATGRISYSHTGYGCGSLKTAIAEAQDDGAFHLLDMERGLEVLKGVAEVVETEIGRFALLDFTSWRQPGRYRLRYGDLETPPFVIDDDVWRGTIWKTLNLFYSERCGIRVPGIHELCHADWQCEHNGQRMVVNGGWHDAGDLSQGLVNTAEATYAMLALSEKLGTGDPKLSAQLKEEALWGLDWALKGRFGDGYRCAWATMDFWTDGIIGTDDDYTVQARRGAFENWVAAAAEALAARLLTGDDRLLARRALIAAQEDWQFACEDDNGGTEDAGAGVLASLELWRTTDDTQYAEKAMALGEVILASQQRQAPDWSLPLVGFFYTSPERTRILRYFHRGHEQGPVVALCALCDAFPEHPRWGDWYGAAALYGEFLRRGAKLTAPYEMLVAGIYATDEEERPEYLPQLQQGVQLDDSHYLRRFPVWYAFRGNLGVMLSQAKGLSRIAQLRDDLHLAQLAELQMQWTVGRNPFSQSLMTGEGYDFAPQYSAMCGDLVGGLPVGIETRDERDVPYWPFTNCHNYKEIWVHPSARWLWLLDDLGGPCQVRGRAPQGTRWVRFVDEAGQCQDVAIDAGGAFSETLSPGRYTVIIGDAPRTVVAMPGAELWLDLSLPHVAKVSAHRVAGEVKLAIQLAGKGRASLSLKLHNLSSTTMAQEVDLASGSKTIEWPLTVIDDRAPWVGVIMVDGDTSRRTEIIGGLPWA